MKFYRCEHCGNITTLLNDNGVPLFCCGEKMKQLLPGAIDASVEKHVPVLSQIGSVISVQVGSVEHPMIPEHYIQFIALETSRGFQIKYLSPGQKPVATFVLSEDDKLISAYEYCNLHGLWKS